MPTSVCVTAPALPSGAISLTLQKLVDGTYVDVVAGLAGGAYTDVPGLAVGTAYTFRYLAVNSSGNRKPSFYHRANQTQNANHFHVGVLDIQKSGHAFRLP